MGTPLIAGQSGPDVSMRPARSHFPRAGRSGSLWGRPPSLVRLPAASGRSCLPWCHLWALGREGPRHRNGPEAPRTAPGGERPGRRGERGGRPPGNAGAPRRGRGLPAFGTRKLDGWRLRLRPAQSYASTPWRRRRRQATPQGTRMRSVGTKAALDHLRAAPSQRRE